MIVLNFKTYEQGTGKKGLELAQVANTVAKETGKEIVLAVQTADLYPISRAVSIPVFAQHIDPILFGNNTGSLLPEAAKAAGASGTIINHAERRTGFIEIKKTIERCKDLGLKSLVCVGTIENAQNLIGFKPDYMAFEDPELIASGKSIASEQPQKVKAFVHLLENSRTIPLCGAGVSTQEDVKKSQELGTKGVILASAVLKAKDPKEALRGIAAGL